MEVGAAAGNSARGSVALRGLAASPDVGLRSPAELQVAHDGQALRPSGAGGETPWGALQARPMAMLPGADTASPYTETKTKSRAVFNAF